MAFRGLFNRGRYLFCFSVLSAIQCEDRNKSRTGEKTSFKWKNEFLCSNLQLQLGNKMMLGICCSGSFHSLKVCKVTFLIDYQPSGRLQPQAGSWLCYTSCISKMAGNLWSSSIEKSPLKLPL